MDRAGRRTRRVGAEVQRCCGAAVRAQVPRCSGAEVRSTSARQHSGTHRSTAALLHRCTSAGFTFVELLVVTALVAILASAVMPLAHIATQRQHEAELRQSLREIRTAIDHYKDAADGGQIPPTSIRTGSEGYPPDLQTLVVGVPPSATATRRTRSSSCGGFRTTR